LTTLPPFARRTSANDFEKGNRKLLKSMPTKVIVARNTRLTPKDLPTSIEELRQFALNALQQMQHARDEQDKLHPEVDNVTREMATRNSRRLKLHTASQPRRSCLSKANARSKNGCRHQKGKKEERLHPNQLLLFELGELEQLIEEVAKADEAQSREEASSKSVRRKKKKHGRRIVPDNLPTEVILHELPEEQRLCSIDGKPMPAIRYEISEQLDLRGCAIVLIS
jgi:septal ring factor EnvC (AmiA/AmiB activator)